MPNLKEIEGVGPEFANKLADAGITTTEQLLATAGGASGRKQLAAKTGLSEGRLLEWANRADLMRLKGIGSEFSDLLEGAGVDTVAELANRSPANLAAKLAEVNESKHLTRRVPTESQVQEWVSEAKKLTPMVTH
jgi:predicted flap endonuclease-1-like 5' DNA nuclease